MTTKPGPTVSPTIAAPGGADWPTIVAGVGAAINAGVFLCFSAFVMPAVGELPAPQGIEAMQAFNRTAVAPFTLVGLSTAVVCVVVIVRALRRWGAARSRWALTGAVVFLIAAVMITFTANVPISASIDAPAPAARPTRRPDGPTSTPSGSGRTTYEQSAPSPQPPCSRSPRCLGDNASPHGLNACGNCPAPCRGQSWWGHALIPPWNTKPVATQLFPMLSCSDLGRSLAFYADLLEGVETYQLPEDGEPAFISLRIGEASRSAWVASRASRCTVVGNGRRRATAWSSACTSTTSTRPLPEPD